MSLKGQGVLAIWNGIDPVAEHEFELWHTNEHIPERVGTPGFLRGRRYVTIDGSAERYLTLYEAEALATFSSAHYLERLNAPSAWTQKMMPFFSNYVRGACAVAASVGQGMGGVLASVRFNQEDAAQVATVAEELAAAIRGNGEVVGVHVGIASADVTNSPAKERELRTGSAENSFGALILIEGISKQSAAARAAAGAEFLRDRGLGDRTFTPAFYRLDYCLGE